MLEDSDRLLSTIEQVLRTGRVGHTTRNLNRTALDLDQVVASCLERARKMHDVGSESIEFKPGPPATVMGDAEEVTAAVSNLIDNAVKYSGPEVRVRVETENLEGKYACGPRSPIAAPEFLKTELKQIFKRFYRVPGPLATRVKGTGLGLYIVRSVAKRHGGRAWAESEGVGHGSTFVLQNFR